MARCAETTLRAGICGCECGVCETLTATGSCSTRDPPVWFNRGTHPEPGAVAAIGVGGLFGDMQALAFAILSLLVLALLAPAITE